MIILLIICTCLVIRCPPRYDYDTNRVSTHYELISQKSIYLGMTMDELQKVIPVVERELDNYIDYYNEDTITINKQNYIVANALVINDNIVVRHSYRIEINDSVICKELLNKYLESISKKVNIDTVNLVNNFSFRSKIDRYDGSVFYPIGGGYFDVCFGKINSLDFKKIFK